MSYRRTTALTALALTGAMTVAMGPAAAGPASTTATDLDVICDAIGEDTVTVTGDLASGGTAEITSGPLSVVGQPGFTGTDAAGDPVTVEPTGEGAVCTVQETTKGGGLDEVLPSGQAAKADADGSVSGRLTFTVEVDTSALPPATGSTSTTAAKLPFESELRSYLNSRPGAVGVAVRLPGTGKSWTYTKTSSRNVTASIVKVQVMSGVMMKAQREGRGLTSWEKSKIVPMIRQSDNNATTALFNHIGGRSGLQSVGDRLGMTQTTANSRWGLTSTTAHDQARLMEHYARPSQQLSYSNRVYGLSQMRQVASSQDWGVSAGPPSGSVALKNGWLPRTDGWHVNSIGWQNYGKADYTIGVLTHDNPGAMNTEIATIEGVSRIVWRNRGELLDSTPTPPKKRGVRGDLDGDGTVDLMGTSATGRVYVMKGNGSGNFGSKRVVKSGLADATWFGSAGDVNRDGRSDVLVRRGNGRLQLMLATSSGKLGTLKTVATGWGSYTDIASGVDVNGNGSLDIVNRKVGGHADLYQLSDSGKLTRAGSMGQPFIWYPRIRLVADVNGDGRGDMRGVASGGRMRTWTSTGSAWRQTSATSLGWDDYRTVAVPGDVNGASSKQDDVVVPTSSGSGRTYLGAKGGGLANGFRGVTEPLGGLPYIF